LNIDEWYTGIDQFTRADQLSTADCVQSLEPAFSPIQRSLVIGSLMGDMYASNTRGCWISWSHIIKQQALSNLKLRVLSPHHATKYNRTSGYGSEMILYTIHASKEIRPIHEMVYSNHGKKLVTKEVLDEIDELAMAIWYMDDGSLSHGQKGKQRPRANFHTEGFSLDENQLIVDWFWERWEIKAVIVKSRQYNHIRLNADAAIQMWDIIAEYIIPEMRYKLPELYSNHSCYWDTFVPATEKHQDYRSRKVLSVEPWDDTKRHRKYDLTTNIHNFVANGFVVHNSMIYPVEIDGEIAFCTKRGVTDIAKDALAWAKATDEEYGSRYIDFCRDMIIDGRTPMFEWIGRGNRIVVDYKVTTLVLTAVRNLHDGMYISVEDLATSPEVYGMATLRQWAGDFNGITDFTNEVKERTEEEGYVIRFSDGHMIKIKNLWYLKIHRAKDAITFEKNVIKLIVDNDMDDILPELTQDEQDRINTFTKAFWDNVNKTIDDIDDIIDKAKEDCPEDEDRNKWFSLNVVKNHPMIMSSILFMVWQGRNNSRDGVMNIITSNLNNSSTVDKIRPLFGDINWNEY